MTFHMITNTAARVKILLLAVVGLMLMPHGLQAQTRDRLMFSKQRMTISELLREVERQTGNVVVVSADRIDDGRMVILPATSGTLNDIFRPVLAGVGCDYQVRDGYIVITALPQKPLQPQRSPIIIDKSGLKRFVADAMYEEDSVVHSVTDAGPFRFDARDRSFYAPGIPDPDGKVAPPFTTAERWQRSKLAVKTNMLYGAGTLTPNLRVEAGLGNRTTLEVGAAYNGWNLRGTPGDNRKLVHAIAMAEYRYWLCERFAGHYFGVHGFGGRFNVGGHDIPTLFEKEFRCEGPIFGGGVSYGYAVPLSLRWGLEFNVGVGAAYLSYDKYACEECGRLERTDSKIYFGPTRAAINLVFIIK